MMILDKYFQKFHHKNPLDARFELEQMLNELDGVFAFVLVDKQHQLLLAARDPVGVRPLYISLNPHHVALTSELSGLKLTKDSTALPMYPGTCFVLNLKNGCKTYHKFAPIFAPGPPTFSLLPKIVTNVKYIKRQIRTSFLQAVRKRVKMTDRDVGFFLSGGLDSSLILGAAAKILLRESDKINIFSIGHQQDSPDLKAVRVLYKWFGTTFPSINANFHLVNFDYAKGFQSIPDVITHLQTYDVTTIRAATPQFILSAYIRQKTTVRVVLSGEGSDELCGGYQYFKLAPTATDARLETLKLLGELHYFDVCRTDRVTAAHGLEVRVPFLDLDFVKFVLMLPPHLLLPYHREKGVDCTALQSVEDKLQCVEKYLLRDLFEDLLPSPILWRRKDAFSDAVGYPWVDYIQQQANNLISDEVMLTAPARFPIHTPQTKEAMWYRLLYEEHVLKPQMEQPPIPHFWMPNREWTGENLKDPSARVLSCFRQ